MPSKVINYSLPSLGNREQEGVNEVLKSQMISQDEKLHLFEDHLAKQCEVEFAVAVSSGSAALHLAYLAAGIKTGDDVLVPAITFASTATAAIHCGARPVPVDISSETLAMDPEDLKANLKSAAVHPKLIVPVSMGGHPYKRQEIYQIATEFGVPVVADMSHAMGSEYHTGESWQPFTDSRYESAVAVSFQALKNITTGEGGAVLTHDADFANRVRTLRNHGIHSLNNADEPWRYDILHPGFNYRISEMQCAMGVAQLDRLTEMQEKRKKLAEIYLQEFKDIKGVKLPPQQANFRNSWHLFIIRISQRTRLYNQLLEAGFKCQVHYVPIHYLSFMNRYLMAEETEFPESEVYYNQCLSLPLFPDLKEEDQEEIIKIVKRHVREI